MITHILPTPDPGLSQAIADLHEQVGAVGPEQVIGWEPMERTGTSIWIVSLSGARAVAASRVTLHFSRRQLSCIARAVRGPVARSAPDFAGHLADTVRAVEQHADELYIQPRVEHASKDQIAAIASDQGFSAASGLGSPAATLVVDLRPPLSRVLQSFRSATQRQVRSIARRGLACRVLTSERELLEMLGRYNQFAQIRDLGRIPESAALQMFSRVSGRSQLPLLLPVAAHAAGELVGGAFFMVCGERLVYQWGFTDRIPGNPLPVTHACFWHAIEAVHGCGVTEFDLGGYWVERGETDPINRFKTGFGGKLEHYGPKLHRKFMRRIRWRAMLPRSAPQLTLDTLGTIT